MEEYQYEKINIFNRNFINNNVKKIIELYKKESSIIQYLDEINLKEEKYMHPLFKNYNYCLFCGEKAKTKYYFENLVNNHINLEEKTLGNFLCKNNIKLRDIKNKKERIVKRRFIHSYDNFLKNEKYYYNQLPIKSNDESDTELYIFNNNKIQLPKMKNKKYRNRFISFDALKSIKKASISDRGKNQKPHKRKNSIKYDIILNGEILTSNENNYILNTSSDKKINSEESINEQDEINGNININNINNDKETDDYFIEIKNSNDVFRRKSETKTSSKLFKKGHLEKILIENSNINSHSKLETSNRETVIEGNKENNNINISTKNEEILNFSKDEDKKSVKSINKIKEVINEARKFFGFGKRQSVDRNIFFHQPNFEKLDKSDILKRNPTIRDSKLKAKIQQTFIEKNDNCLICQQEIKEKFTLICGDFFCRDCIREEILTAIKKISNLDKLSCPTCGEQIEENTIKKLLSDEEFNTYKNLITKIIGLKNKDKDLIPCPYPDCPGWAKENQTNSNIIYCQYDHTFCKKCLNVVDDNCREDSSNHHCNENISEEEKKTMSLFKENKFIRKCPNCQSMVVREGGGCNNMTCTNIWCGYEFCWICNRKYEESHYKNPLSMCFGLSETNYNGKLAKYTRVRFCRCILIFILIIFVILPVIVVFFSIFEAVLFVITFVLDGSAMKNIKLKSEQFNKFFYKFAYAFYIAIGVAFIPFGYMSLALLIVLTPIFLILNKIRQKNDDELE